MYIAKTPIRILGQFWTNVEALDEIIPNVKFIVIHEEAELWLGLDTATELALLSIVID